MRSSKPIPKELMTPYQRWEMASFDEEELATAATPTDKSLEELAALRAAAQAEGHAAGLQQGHAEGYAKGLHDGLDHGQQESRAITQQLRAVADSFSEQVAASSATVAPALLDLALDIAKAMLKTALPIRPQLVLPIISAALHALPNLQLPATILLHPDDAALLREHSSEPNELSAAAWRILDNPALERGSCRIDTASNQIDASSVSRWRRIAAALSKESDWLAP